MCINRTEVLMEREAQEDKNEQLHCNVNREWIFPYESPLQRMLFILLVYSILNVHEGIKF